jgi:hypothetical protein
MIKPILLFPAGGEEVETGGVQSIRTRCNFFGQSLLGSPLSLGLRAIYYTFETFAFVFYLFRPISVPRE